MSLNVYLEISGIFVLENGHCVKGARMVYSANITHNLNIMSHEAGIYECLWTPNEIGIEKGGQLIAPLRAGLLLLESDPGRFMEFNPTNRWGSYDVLVEFVREYLKACEKYPMASVSVWR